MTGRFQGLNAWLLQRVSALYLAGFVIYSVFYFSLSPPAGYDEWRQWVAGPVVSIAIFLFVLLLLGHVWVGLRDVFMDYISSLILRAIGLLILAIGLVACGIWVIKIMIPVMFV